MSFACKRIYLCLLILACVSLAACQPKTARSEEPTLLGQQNKSLETQESSLRIVAVGDIMLGSPFPNDTRMPPNDGVDLLNDVTPILSAADIAFGNLEGPIIDGGTSTKCSPRSTRCFAFRMPTRYGKYLKDAGFDVLSLANNHAGDFGDAGRASTRRVLDELGIKHAGSDRGRYSTGFLEVKGLKIAFVGFAHNAVTPNVNDLSAAARLVKQADEQADLVVVSFHGGAEGTDSQNVPNRTELYAGEERGNLPAFARTVIDAGADLVLGHGPHVLRGIEIYKDRLIAYSLGNFATYGWFKLEAETALTILLDVHLDANGKFIAGKIHSGRQQGRGIPVLDPQGAAIDVVRRLSEADFGPRAVKIAPDGTISAR